MRHEDTLQSEEFRASWFAVVGLLRSVGHVLAKVDAKSSEGMRRAVELKWRLLCSTRPEPAIFWGFIESERNRFLKNYEHGISRTITLPSLTPGINIVSDRGRSRGSQLNPGTKCKSVIASGPFSGEGEQKVAWEAYEWWSSYLEKVDSIAASGSAF